MIRAIFDCLLVLDLKIAVRRIYVFDTYEFEALVELSLDFFSVYQVSLRVISKRLLLFF